MISFLEKHTQRRNIIIGLLVIVIINVVIFPLFPQWVIGRSIPLDGILDLQFGFSVEQVHSLMSALGEDGRYAYRLSTILVDIPYAMIYGFVYSFILIALLKK